MGKPTTPFEGMMCWSWVTLVNVRSVTQVNHPVDLGDCCTFAPLADTLVEIPNPTYTDEFTNSSALEQHLQLRFWRGLRPAKCAVAFDRSTSFGNYPCANREKGIIIGVRGGIWLLLILKIVVYLFLRILETCIKMS